MKTKDLPEILTIHFCLKKFSVYYPEFSLKHIGLTPRPPPTFVVLCDFIFGLMKFHLQ